VKLAAIDGEFHERKRARITNYFVETCGYDETFVNVAADKREKVGRGGSSIRC
jgi:hypothetical protein